MTVVILGTKVKVKLHDFEDDTKGDFDEELLLIRLSRNLKGKELQSVYKHEQFHAFLFLTGFTAILQPQAEELLVEALERFEPDVIKIRHLLNKSF